MHRVARLVAALVLMAPACTLVPTAEAATAAERSNVVVEKRAIGTSVQGRTIWAYRKGSPSAATKVVLLGQMHGDESGALAAARHALGSVPVLRSADVWIIPTMNPDGRAAGTRVNARKVDLNRNFPHVWRRQGYGTRTYSGPTAASEPETRALVAFLGRVKPRFVVSLHQPLVGVDSYGVKDHALMGRLVTGVGLPARSFACSGICRGTLTGWFNARHPGAAITVELGRSPSAAFLQRTGRESLRAMRAY